MGPVFGHRADADEFRVGMGRRGSGTAKRSGTGKNGQKVLRTGEHLVGGGVEYAGTPSPALRCLQETESLMKGLRKIAVRIDDVWQRERRTVEEVLDDDISRRRGRALD